MRLTCPICDKVEECASHSAWPRFPFCSDRCRLIDLGRWLGESYRVSPVDAPNETVETDESSNP